jgi:hypothetical protein
MREFVEELLHQDHDSAWVSADSVFLSNRVPYGCVLVFGCTLLWYGLLATTRDPCD